jgi:hypothetical protein
MAMTTLERLREEIDQIPIVDTHEHIVPRKEVLETQVDLFAFLGLVQK